MPTDVFHDLEDFTMPAGTTGVLIIEVVGAGGDGAPSAWGGGGGARAQSTLTGVATGTLFNCIDSSDSGRKKGAEVIRNSDATSVVKASGAAEVYNGPTGGQSADSYGSDWAATGGNGYDNSGFENHGGGGGSGLSGGTTAGDGTDTSGGYPNGGSPIDNGDGTWSGQSGFGDGAGASFGDFDGGTGTGTAYYFTYVLLNRTPVGSDSASFSSSQSRAVHANRSGSDSVSFSESGSQTVTPAASPGKGRALALFW